MEGSLEDAGETEDNEKGLLVNEALERFGINSKESIALFSPCNSRAIIPTTAATTFCLKQLKNNLTALILIPHRLFVCHLNKSVFLHVLISPYHFPVSPV